MNKPNNQYPHFRQYIHLATGLALTAVLACGVTVANAESRGPSADGARHANVQQHRARMAEQHRQRKMREGTRTITRTRPDGATATRTTTVDIDQESQTRTRTTEGERFDGSTYSSSDVMQRSEDGFTRESTRTNAEGVTTSRNVVATIDKEAGTLHKEITVVDKDGETHTRVIDRSRGDNESDSAE
ncbi:hypothetical protein NBRC116494_33520 [Aurantivibrio plasticivorans]